MPTKKIEGYSFGGVDSRSSPANYPVDRAIRCLNWTPQESGALQLRMGYSLAADSTNGTTIHSLIYYEQFSAVYLGPQYLLRGRGTAIDQVQISNGAVINAGAFTTSNPWGHFRSNNRVFISDGTTNYNWDGTKLRITGIPGITNQQIGSVSTSAYAGSGANSTIGGDPTWTNPGNATGPPDGTYTTVILPTGNESSYLVLSNMGLAIPAGAQIFGIQVNVTGHVTTTSTDTFEDGSVRLSVNGSPPTSGSVEPFAFPSGGGDVTKTVGGPTDTFSLGLSPSIVNSAAFSIYIQVGGSVGFSTEWFIDAVEIVVFYSAIEGSTSTVTASSVGSLTPTLLTGYQVWASIYNPITQHAGNRAPIGEVLTVSATQSVIVLNNLPNLASVNTEWVYLLGMTEDGGQIPYALVDPQGNDIFISNGQTMGTVYFSSIDLTQELPFQNDVPTAMDKFARVGTRIFGHLSGNPFLQYSNDEADVSNADYVGQPVESWPADQQEPLPTGELPTCIHGYKLEGWFFSRQNLCIWSEFLLQQGVNPWRGPWPGGCVGQRAFIETPEGPFWLSGNKELCTFMEDGVISVSDEYEQSLLGQIADSNIGKTELGYQLDQEGLINKIMVKGLDGNGNPIIVCHDFNLREQRSAHGQGYQYQYTAFTLNTFVGAGYTPRQNAYDTNGKMRLWAGGIEGFIAQLEYGNSDNGTTYSGDYISLIGMGSKRPLLAELEYQGDPNLQISYLPDYSLSIGDFIPIAQDTIPETIQTSSRFGAKFQGDECRWFYCRFQLTAHPADGNFSLTNPPFLPLPTYGVVNEITMKTGSERPEGR